MTTKDDEKAFDELATISLGGDLEEEFRATVNYYKPKIELLVKESMDKWNEAKEIADKHGVPFNSPVYCVEQQYTPKSFKEKFCTVKDPEDYDDLPLEYQVYEAFDINPYARDGFEADGHWRSSNMTC